jgi:hypothetical protein
MILNDICVLFMRHFYMQLVSGRTVQKAFEEAQSTIRASSTNCKSCCCAHSHTKDCIWYKYARMYGYEKAHELHSDKGNCTCNLSGN